MKPKHTILVGAFLIGGVVLFGVGLFMIGSESSLFAHTFIAYAWFSKMSGLSAHAQVHVAGYNAGTVSDIQVPQRPDGKFRVTLKIDNKFKALIRQSSVASVQTQGMVGDEFVEIDPGNPQSAACGNNCTKSE